MEYSSSIASSGRRRIGWLLTAVVIGCAAFYTLAFSTIYWKPHSYTKGSEWIYRHVAPGSSIAGVHWDDRVPVGVPGFESGSFKTDIELPLYERDLPSKIKLVAERVAQADYIALPTQRLPGSVLRVPDEFPQTTSFFKQLYAGLLGYRLEKTVKPRPRLFGIEFNDDLADESISVYDHSKVTIFRNVDRLSKEEIERRIVNPPSPAVLPTLRDIMTIDAPVEAATIHSSLPALGQVVVWIVVLELLTWIGFPFIAALFPTLRDRGFGIAKSLGLLAIGLIAWQLSSFGLLRLSSFNLWALVLGAGVLSHLFVSYHFGSWTALCAPIRGVLRTEQVIWYLIFVLFLIVRAVQPEIFWGEKPMDFTFLNYFVRLDYVPPRDPWAAGEPMHYYYLGTLLIAIVHKLGSITPAIGYNLAMATLPALIATASMTVLLQLGLRRLPAALGALGILMLSNLEVVYLLVVKKLAVNFDLYWASTRLFTAPAFAEYPLWSMLFGDLHAHVIALPFALSFVALATLLPQRIADARVRRPLQPLILGVVFGALFLINSWDFIAYSFLVGVLVTTGIVRGLKTGQGERVVGRVLASAFFDGVLMAVGAALTIAPFLQVSGGKIETHYGWVQQSEFNNLGHLLRHFGLWIIVVVSALGVISRYGKLFERKNLGAVGAGIVGVSLPFLLGLASASSGISALPWDVLTLAAIIIGIGVLFVVLSDEEESSEILGAFIITAGVVLAVCELVFLNDRMNTIFKFYSSLWLLLGLGSMAIVPRLLRECGGHSGMRWSLSNSGIILLPLGALLVAIVGSVLTIFAITTFERIKGVRPSLNGQLYLTQDVRTRDEFAAINWMNATIPGTPTLLEAQGDSYREFSRITMHTGLPTVLGWEHHVHQRGTPVSELRTRKEAVRTIYDTSDLAQARELLRMYNIQLIYVGEVERRNYLAEGLRKFDDHPALFPVLFRQGNVAVYTVHNSLLAALAAPR